MKEAVNQENSVSDVGAKGISGLQQLVSFKLGSEEYGVQIMRVQEIIRVQEITKVPQMPDFIEGVINLRGNVIPVIDLRKRFDMESKSHDDGTRIIVVNVEDRIIGVVVDSVEEVQRIDSAQVDPPPLIVQGIGRDYIQGVCRLENRLLILLDLDKVLAQSEIEALSEHTH